MTLQELLTSKRSEVLRLAEQHGAYHVRVFGSVVRGEAGPESDVDFLVERGPNPSRFFPGGLIADLEDLLGCRVHVVTEKALHRMLRDEVMREAVPV
jgi:predicted nucleotidyltransferase